MKHAAKPVLTALVLLLLVGRTALAQNGAPLSRAEQFYLQSKALLDAKDYDGAAQAIQSALRYLPRSTTLINQAVGVYLKSGDLDKAYTYQQKLVRADPRNPIYYQTLAWLACENQDFDVARRYAEKTLRAVPEPAENAYKYAADTLKRLTTRRFRLTWEMTPQKWLAPQDIFSRVNTPLVTP